MASNFCVTVRRSDEAGEVDDEEPAAHGDDVFEQCDRQVASAIRRDQPLAGLVAAQRAKNGTDDPGAERAEGVEPGAPDDRSSEGAHDEPRGELWRGLAARRLR